MSCNHPDVSRLNDIGKKYMEFRTNNRSNIFGMGMFGLPVYHRSANTTVRGMVNGEILRRRSSPLIFKVLESKGIFYWMVLKLCGDFLPEGGSLVLTEKEKGRKEVTVVRSGTPDWRWVNKFLDSLKGVKFNLKGDDKR